MNSLLIYGANGYTGSLIARTAETYGILPVLAGRNAREVEALAAELGMQHRIFDVNDAGRNLQGIGTVLNCAGPFSRTAREMVHACMHNSVHYLDITGEIAAFEMMAALDASARNAGVMLVPGVGFDVVPSDCLAAHVAARLPDATHLMIGISGSGRLSRGTMTTALEKGGAGGQVRRNGRIVNVPAGWKTRDIDFGVGALSAVTIPWGDVATAFHSTGIPDIEVYAVMPRRTQLLLRSSRRLGWMLRRPYVRDRLQSRIRSAPAGPSERELASGQSRVWARAENSNGDAVEGLVIGPNGYMLTAHAALLACRQVMAESQRAGYFTPSRAFGADFVLEIPGTRRVDIL